MNTIRKLYDERNAEIYRLFEHEGMRQKAIGMIYGLSESRVKAIINEQRMVKNEAIIK